MERLWAPWRMTYIDGIGDKCECFLCCICEDGQNGKDCENLVIARREKCFAVLNRYPYNNGHLLICPTVHKGSMQELDAAEMVDMMTLTGEMMTLLKRVMRADGFNVGMNFGRVAGAGLPTHMHIHIVPRWDGDTNFMPVLADTKIIPQALEDLRDVLVAALREMPAPASGRQDDGQGQDGPR